MPLFSLAMDKGSFSYFWFLIFKDHLEHFFFFFVFWYLKYLYSFLLTFYFCPQIFFLHCFPDFSWINSVDMHVEGCCNQLLLCSFSYILRIFDLLHPRNPSMLSEHSCTFFWLQKVYSSNLSRVMPSASSSIFLVLSFISQNFSLLIWGRIQSILQDGFLRSLFLSFNFDCRIFLR